MANGEKRGLILERTVLFILGLSFIAISIRHNAKGHEEREWVQVAPSFGI